MTQCSYLFLCLLVYCLVSVFYLLDFLSAIHVAVPAMLSTLSDFMLKTLQPTMG